MINSGNYSVKCECGRQMIYDAYDEAKIDARANELKAAGCVYCSGAWDKLALPAITGSEKQIAWAEDIRRDVIEALYNQTKCIAAYGANDRATKAIDAVIRRADARYWIDRRNYALANWTRDLRNAAA